MRIFIVEWQTKDPDMLKRINKLIRDIERDPFRGIGKPEEMAFWKLLSAARIMAAGKTEDFFRLES